VDLDWIHLAQETVKGGGFFFFNTFVYFVSIKRGNFFTNLMYATVSKMTILIGIS